MYKLDLEKAEEPEIKLPTSIGSEKKQENYRKTSTSASLTTLYTKAFDCVDHNKLWKILQDIGIPDHLTCLLRNLHAGQEATVRTGHGTTDWFKVGKEVCQGCILSPCLFNLYAESIMQNVWLNESQAGINNAGRNINNLRWYHSNGRKWRGTKGPLDELKEETEKADLQLNIQKTKTMASGRIISWKVEGEKMEAVTFSFLGLQNHYRWWLQSWN